MPFDWLGFGRLAQSLFTGGASAYRALVGRSPTLRLEIGEASVKLRISNPREETVLVEHVEATPPLLSFMAGDSVDAATRALVSRDHRPTEPLVILNGLESASVDVVTFGAFNSADDGTLITLTAHWRSAHRGRFSHGRSKVKISVQDVRQLRAEVEQRQPRLFGIYQG